MADKAQIMDAIGFASIGYGIGGLLAPSALTRAYGLADTADTRYLGRLFASRNLVLGVLTLSAASEDRDRLLLFAAGVNVLDTAAAFVGLSSGMSKRAGVLTALTTAGFAAASVVALGRD